MNTPDVQVVRQALARVYDPEIRRPLTELDMVRKVAVDGNNVRVELALTIVACPAADRIKREVREAILTIPGIDTLELNVGVMTPNERDTLIHKIRPVRRMPFGPGTLTRVIAVGSGKGGVGKSTITAELAVIFASRGLRTGLIDADVFGFSIPSILGLANEKPTRVGEMMMPPRIHDVSVISIGMFAPEGKPVSWRGPLLHRTVKQFLSDVYFGDLDVLLIDLPPGTGDVAITLGQLLPNAELLVVTTPQRAAAQVAERAGLLARQSGQEVIGMVENMAGEFFGTGGGAKAADRLGVPLLTSIPLSTALSRAGDAGKPLVLHCPNDPSAVALKNLASTVLARGRQLAGRALL